MQKALRRASLGLLLATELVPVWVSVALDCPSSLPLTGAVTERAHVLCG